MAFLTVASNEGPIEDRLPLLTYDARAGRAFTIDRVQGPDGWSTVKLDITMQQPAFAIDFGTLEVGWAFFSTNNAPMWAVAPYGQPMPVRPPSPGKDDKGKTLNFKAAFRVKVCGQGIGGVREFGGNAGVLIGGMNDLHTAFEASPEAAAGKIPVVKLANTTPVKAGQSTNYQPAFAIQQWVDRPTPLGARTVPAPGAKIGNGTGNGHASTTPSNHVPPPVAHVPTPAFVAAAVAAMPAPTSMPF